MQTLFDEGLALSFQKVVEESLTEFFNDTDMPSFQKSLRDGVNRICTTIQQRLLEHIDQELVNNCSLRKGWTIERKNEVKTLLSPFGPVTYRRTYFHNKKAKKYAHLADRLVGYTPHQRLDTLLEADVVYEAINMSYRKAGESQERRAQDTGLTGQTVLNLVREFAPEKLTVKEKPKIKRESRIIYIEADEDHIAHQDKDSYWFEQKLVYVHEGCRKVSKNRNELIGKKYFTFSRGTKSEDIWNKVLGYLWETYDLERTEHIFISGDGASWIKAGADYIPNSYYVMDGFHLRQAIFRAAGADGDKREALAQAIWHGKWAQMNRLLNSLREEATEESRKTTIHKTLVYLNRNWSGIQAKKKYRELLVGCSAEGHVSHILSARLSTRPMGWSYLGANQMAHLRVQQANDVDIHQAYLDQRGKEKKSFVHDYMSVKLSKPIAKAVGGNLETLGNLPSLNRGSRTFGPLLRQIANATLDI